MKNLLFILFIFFIGLNAKAINAPTLSSPANASSARAAAFASTQRVEEIATCVRAAEFASMEDVKIHAGNARVRAV
jgi:hypothetical protein